MPVSIVTYEDNMEMMSRYPAKYWDLAVPDPPYGIGAGTMNYTRAAGRLSKQKNGSRIRVGNKGYLQKDWDDAPPPLEFFHELRRVSKHQIIWGWNYFGLDWGPGLIKWNKLVAEGVGYSKYEYAYCSLIDYEMEIQLLWSGFQQAKSLAEPDSSLGYGP